MVGDFVFLKRVPAAVAETGNSRRLFPTADPQVFVVHRFLTTQTVIFAGLDAGETDSSFAQPISASRLVPFDVTSLETLFDDGALHLEICAWQE